MRKVKKYFSILLSRTTFKLVFRQNNNHKNIFILGIKKLCIKIPSKGSQNDYNKQRKSEHLTSHRATKNRVR